MPMCVCVCVGFISLSVFGCMWRALVELVLGLLKVDGALVMRLRARAGRVGRRRKVRQLAHRHYGHSNARQPHGSGIHGVYTHTYT
jgi:hypothetical protein